MPRVLLVLALLLAAGACGEPSRAPAPSAPGASDRGEPTLPSVSAAERARFALERLFEGPLRRTDAFRIPHLHPTNLEFAIADLAALPEETARLLGEAALVERVTSAPPAARNPWHGVLDVLARLPEAPFELVRQWTEPALATRDVSLVRRAVARLAQEEDPAAFPLLLGALGKRPTDREIVRHAAAALIARGGPWRQAALETLRAHGSATARGLATGWLAHLEDSDGALAWWGLVTEIGGPQPVADLEPDVMPAWNVARILASDRVWPGSPGAVDRMLAAGRLLAPVAFRETLASRPAVGRPTSAVPLADLRADSAIVAAQARCALAGRDHAAYGGAVEADRVSADPLRQLLARECVLPSDDQEGALEEATFIVTTFLDALGTGFQVDASGVAAALLRLETAGRAPELAWRVLAEARPLAAYGPLVRGAHDLLREREEERLVAWVKAALGSSDPEEQAVGSFLARSAPHGAYLAPLEAMLAAASDDAARTQLQKLLVWVTSNGSDVPEATRAAFARRFAGWVDEVPDPWAAGLAPALLDLGPAGATAYAQGLAGPRRGVYVEGLIARRRLVPVDVARAVLAGVDATTPQRDRHAAWVATYLTAPTEAAPALAAARDRVDRAQRGEVDDILEVLRHRAPR